MFDNSDAQGQLVETLRQHRHALLLVGAGSSRIVGYPSWPELLDQLRQEIVPEDPFPENLGLLEKASFIRNRLRAYDDREARERQFLGYLESTFRPRISTNFAGFHKTLLRLPFCGVATTNYDQVLEIAITVVRSEDGLVPNCHAIDLCNKRPHRVFEFLRGLSAQNAYPAVLHIHGYWEHPEHIVLTAEDYESLYRLQAPTASPRTLEISAPDSHLDTLHRKVVWSLLTMRPVVFVGFSLEDPGFDLMLEFVMKDFELPRRPSPHFALLPSRVHDSQAEQQERDAKRLGRFGVLPIFYSVTIDANGHVRHDALPQLIEALGVEVGTPTGTPPLATISRRLMERR